VPAAEIGQTLAHEHILLAASYLKAAEDETTCPVCRAHIATVRVLTEDLSAIAYIGDDMQRHPALPDLMVKVTQNAEAIGILGLIARVFHRIRGGR